MKQFLQFICLASCLSAAPFPHVRFWDFSGPRTVIAGNRSFFVTTPMYAFNFTVDPATSIFKVTGGTYTPTNGDILTVETSGTLPGGMYSLVDNYWPNWDVCDVGVGGAGTFHLKQDANNFTVPGPCTGTLQTVSDAGTGIHTASLYNTNTSSWSLYLNSDPTGFPAGTTFAYKVPLSTSECNYSARTNSGGKIFSPYGPTICIVASVPPNATPGTMTTHITFCGTNASGNCTTFDWVIDVVAPPNITYAPPSSFTSIPGLAKWEGVMTARPCPNSMCGNAGDPASLLSGPANYCDPLSSPSPVNYLGAATSSTVSFYGWNLLFDNMAIYTGNPVYRTGCFQAGMGHAGTTDLQSVRHYVTAGGGSMIGYAHFTESLFRAARAFNDSSYSDAGLLMKNNYIVAYGPKLGLSQLRENSYGLDDAVALFKYGNYNAPTWADVRDGLYGFVLRATESNTSGVRYAQQAYMLGLAAHAFEADWQVSADPRAPYAIKRILDYEWANYDKTNHMMMNLEGPAGTSPWCADFNLWFTSSGGVDGNCGTHPPNWQSLQMMIVHAFWWYYAYTGDTTYRDEGDDWFAHAFDQGGLTGKQASEAYYDSFNAVGWRTGTLKVNQWYGDAQASVSCDLNGDGQVNVIDVQLASNQALAIAACTNGDLNGDGHCTVVDVMRVVSASLGATCNTAP